MERFHNDINRGYIYLLKRALWEVTKIRNWRTNHKLEISSQAREGGRWVRKAADLTGLVLLSPQCLIRFGK